MGSLLQSLHAKGMLNNPGSFASFSPAHADCSTLGQHAQVWSSTPEVVQVITRAQAPAVSVCARRWESL
eukprot:125816-Amphidinium_carterae.1